MRLVHLSDLHLGYRSYGRTTVRGVNQREADVARTFGHAIDRTIALAPAAVVIAGDIFHAVRPPNEAIKHAYQQFAKLRAALPDAPVIMVAGNHDTPRTAETGNILGLFAALGVTVVDGEAQRLDFPTLDLAVLAVPDNHHERPELAPVAGRKYNVLLLHGEAKGISPAGSDAAKRELSPSELHAPEWDYIALGHYHVYREITPNCFYSGAIDYTSSDIWGERAEEIREGIDGKGIVERDLATRAQTFHALPVSRHIIDLPPIAALCLSPAEVNDAIADALESIEGGVDGKVIRLKVQDIDKPVARALDHAMLRDYRRRALQFQIEFQRPESRTVRIGSTVRHRAPLDQIVRSFFMEREWPSDIHASDIAALASQYIEAAGEDRAVIRVEELRAPDAVEIAA